MLNYVHMLIVESILLTTKKLQAAKITSARLDAELLHCFVIGMSKATLLAHSDELLNLKQAEQIQKLCERRLQHEPIAYITGYKEFYGRDFSVNSSVLVPRPESESFITLLHDLKNNLIKYSSLSSKNTTGGFLHTALDVGTGSGCLAITVKLEFTDMFVTATDTSSAALKVAIANARRLNTDIVFKKQSLLTSDKQGYDVVLANLPYVPEHMQHISIASEPREALFSGDDGLNHYRKLFEQLKLKHIRFVLSESLLTQHEAIESLAINADYTLVKTDGLVQLFVKNNPLF